MLADCERLGVGETALMALCWQWITPWPMVCRPTWLQNGRESAGGLADCDNLGVGGTAERSHGERGFAKCSHAA